MTSSEKYLIEPDELENLEPIKDIAEWMGVNVSSLENLASKRAKNGFPEPSMTLGRYHLYDKRQVKNWYALWSKINRSMGNPNLNGKEKTDG